MNDLFKNKERGFLIELGANDCLFQSNKTFFEFYKKGHLLILLLKDIYYVKNSQKSVSLNYVYMIYMLTFYNAHYLPILTLKLKDTSIMLLN